MKAVLAVTEGRGVDVVFENVGDPRLWPKAIESMAVGGRLLTVGTHAGDGILPVDVRRLYRNRLRIMGGLGAGSRGDTFIDEALRGVAEGRYRVLIDRVLALSQAADGFRLVIDNQAIGKVILDPTGVAGSRGPVPSPPRWGKVQDGGEGLWGWEWGVGRAAVVRLRRLTTNRSTLIRGAPEYPHPGPLPL